MALGRLLGDDLGWSRPQLAVHGDDHSSAPLRREDGGLVRPSEIGTKQENRPVTVQLNQGTARLLSQGHEGPIG